MTAESVLSSAIEVAIGLAGFAGIIAAIRQRDVHLWHVRDRVFLQALFGAASAAILFGFLPGLLHEASIESSTLWRSCSGLLVTWFIAVPIVRIRQMRAQGINMIQTVGDYVGVAWLICLISLQIFNLIQPQAWPYLLGVVGLIGVGFTFFFRLMFGSVEAAGA